MWSFKCQLRALFSAEVAVQTKLCVGCCACVEVMWKFCAKFTKIINIEISFLILIWGCISQPVLSTHFLYWLLTRQVRIATFLLPYVHPCHMFHRLSFCTRNAPFSHKCICVMFKVYENLVSRFDVLVLMWFSKCVSRCVLGELNAEMTCNYMRLCFLLIRGQTLRRWKIWMTILFYRKIRLQIFEIASMVRKKHYFQW